MATKNAALRTIIPEAVKTFMPEMQQQIVKESDEHQEVVDRLADIIRSMPVTYQTEGTDPGDKVVYLHYFYAGSDWYLVEKDHLPEQDQCFGYAVLNSDFDMAEWGYVSIEEIKQTGLVELDFFWTPKKFGEIDFR